jgi:hypothetical protein
MFSQRMPPFSPAIAEAMVFFSSPHSSPHELNIVFVDQLGQKFAKVCPLLWRLSVVKKVRSYWLNSVIASDDVDQETSSRPLQAASDSSDILGEDAGLQLLDQGFRASHRNRQ